MFKECLFISSCMIFRRGGFQWWWSNCELCAYWRGLDDGNCATNWSTRDVTVQLCPTDALTLRSLVMPSKLRFNGHSVLYKLKLHSSQFFRLWSHLIYSYFSSFFFVLLACVRHLSVFHTCSTRSLPFYSLTFDITTLLNLDLSSRRFDLLSLSLCSLNIEHQEAIIDTNLNLIFSEKCSSSRG